MGSSRQIGTRIGGTVAGITALGAAFLLGTVAGGGGPAAAPPVDADAPPVAPALRLADAALTAPGSCDALLASYVRRGVDRVGPYGWDSPVYAMESSTDMAASGAIAEAPVPASRGVVEQGSSATGTNVQEAGVDEPDVVKSDGELLVRVRDGELRLVDVTGTTPLDLGEVDLPADVVAPQLLLAGDTVVVTAADSDATGTRVLTYDVSDPAAPALVDERGYDAALVTAVQHDDVVRVVVTAGLPDLDFVEPHWWRDTDGALEANRSIVEESEIGDWLPSVTTYDASGSATGTAPLLDCSQVTVPRDTATLGTVAVVGFDAADPTSATAVGVATDTRLAYFSADRLYLATSDASAWGCCAAPAMPAPSDDLGRPLPAPVTPIVPPTTTGTSRVHAFALDGARTAYVASGEVDGVIADRWSMDEHDGVLRLALGPSLETGDSSSVVLLEEDGDDLEEVGRVDGLGRGEDMKSVRWFDDLAVVVTFRQVDPLYAVDLADPADPRLLGKLEIPGFSDYLHPLSGQRLLGLGQDADPATGMQRGAQAALFDVSDLGDPQRTDVVHYGRTTTAAAGLDPRQLTWLPDRETALAVVTRGWEGTMAWVSVLEVDGGTLTERRLVVEHGSDVAEVRTVPLPDGRVVLVTGDDVSFLDL